MHGARDTSQKTHNMEMRSPSYWTRGQVLQWIGRLTKGFFVFMVGLGWVTQDRTAAQNYHQPVSPTPAAAQSKLSPSVAQAEATASPSGTVQYSVTAKPAVTTSPSVTANPGKARGQSNGQGAGGAQGQQNAGDKQKAQDQPSAGDRQKAQGQTNGNDARKPQGQGNVGSGCIIGTIFWGATAVALLVELLHSIA